MRGPVRRNTALSRLISCTTASTAPGRKCGKRKYRRPVLPSVKASIALASVVPNGSLTKPSPYFAGRRMRLDTAGLMPLDKRAHLLGFVPRAKSCLGTPLPSVDAVMPNWTLRHPVQHRSET
jgi:hypothetical protein